MKTLKKTLCLVLAVVMVLGLGAISASAKLEYTDNDKITYAEAVDVMSGIGVLAGDERGFRPTDTITRAEAAKIIAYIMIGNAGQADALKANVDPFTDVPATHWAAGYISYCVNAGIINGMGDGTFAPGDNVTGLQFAKMLLCALGYNANDEYVSSDWAIDVSKDALRLGLFDDNLAGATNTPATREECALYAYNVVARTRDGQNGLSKVSYSALLGGYITNVALQGTDSPDANKKGTFAKDFDLDRENKAVDDFGKDTGHHWILTTARRPVITAEYGDDANLKATFTTKVTGADIYNALGSDVSKTSTQLEVYVNGTHAGGGYDDTSAHVGGDGGYAAIDGTGDDTIIALDNFKKANDKTLAGTGNGVQTFVYAKYVNGTLRVKVCVVDTYLAQVTKVVAAKGNKDAETTVKLVKKNVDDGGVNTIAINSGVYTFKTEEFEKDDYVLVTIADKNNAGGNNVESSPNEDGKIVTMVPAVTKETEVSRYSKVGNNVSIVADGTTYTAAKNAAGNHEASPINLTTEKVDSAAGLTNEIVDTKDYTLYIDEFGYLIATSPVESSSSYVYVAQWGVKASTSNSLTDSETLRADVYYADGTHEVVTVNDEKGVFDNVVVDYAETKTAIDNNLIANNINGTDAVKNDGADIKIGLYSLTTEKGKAVLTKDTTKVSYTAYAGGTAYVTKGQAGIDDTSAGTLANRANNKTVFFYVKGNYGETKGANKFSVTVYTGIDNVPTVKASDKANARLAEYAYKTAADTNGRHAVDAALVDSGLKGDTSEIIYFFGGTQSNANFDKDNDGTVRFTVYGGDGAGSVTVKYADVDEADEELDKLVEPGFVRVEGGKLDYIAGVAYDHADFNNVVEEGNVAYANLATVNTVAGDAANTLNVTFDDDTGATQTDVKMPLYDIEDGDIVDLRTKGEKDATNGEITSASDIISALDDGLVNDFDVAISFTGYGATNNTNVLKTIYILGQS